MTSGVAWILAALVGGLGALARFHLDTIVERPRTSEFPLGTLVVNLVGSLCLGLLTGLSVTGAGFLVVGTGLLGSFTTFSTLMLETERLGEEGQPRLALANLAVSFAGGLAAAGLGWLVGAAA